MIRLLIMVDLNLQESSKTHANTIVLEESTVLYGFVTFFFYKSYIKPVIYLTFFLFLVCICCITSEIMTSSVSVYDCCFSFCSFPPSSESDSVKSPFSLLPCLKIFRNAVKYYCTFQLFHSNLCQGASAHPLLHYCPVHFLLFCEKAKQHKQSKTNKQTKQNIYACENTLAIESMAAPSSGSRNPPPVWLILFSSEIPTFLSAISLIPARSIFSRLECLVVNGIFPC